MTEKFFNFDENLLVLFTVIGGSASKNIAKKLANAINGKYVDSRQKIFPDGERKITISEKPKGKTIIVQSTYPPVDSNLIEAISLISKAKQTSLQIIAVIPYLCYMRQDIEFLPGEVVTSSLVAKLLEDAGVTKIITFDIHSKLAINYFNIPIKNLTAVPKIARYFKKLRTKNPIVVSPDLFWSDKAQEFAKILGTDSIALNKQRDRKTGKLEILESNKMDLSGRDIILFDDMISSGGSMVKAAEYVKAQNCGQIFAACIHPLLVGNAQKKMKRAGISKIVSTNTIPNKTNKIDISDILGRSLLDD